MITVPINGNENVFEMLDEADITLAEFMNEDGYGSVTIEQWGSDRNIRQICVNGYTVEADDVSENYQVDLRNEEQFREAYAYAAEAYNAFCPVNKKIPVVWDELEF